jgi:hypothetical protein
MDTKGLARFAPLMGVAAVILWIVGLIFAESDSPGDKASGVEIAATWTSTAPAFSFAATFFGVGSAAFIWFLGSLAARFRSSLGDGRLPSIVLAAGTAAVTAFTLRAGAGCRGSTRLRQPRPRLSPATAETLDIPGTGSSSWPSSSRSPCRRSRARHSARTRLPAWFGWITALLALILIIARSAGPH